jgi:hypothetical protein
MEKTRSFEEAATIIFDVNTKVQKALGRGIFESTHSKCDEH